MTTINDAMAVEVEEDESSPTHNDLMQRVVNLQQQLEEVQRARDAAQQRVTEHEARASELQHVLDERETAGLTWIQTLLETAHEAADRHNLCEVYDEVCGEMGLPGRPQDYNVEIHVGIDLSLTITAPRGSLESERDLRDHGLDNDMVVAALREEIRYSAPDSWQWEVSEWGESD